MDPILSSVQEYIKSGEYFKDARKWYNFKYIYPLSQRSFLLIICVFFTIILVGLALNIRNLFPIISQVRYSLNTTSYQSSANIMKADSIKHDSRASIADIMVKNYLVHRELYDYDNLKLQFIFIQNNSTRIVFRKFFNYMNIDNPDSPVMRYQKYIRRSVNIISTEYTKPDEALITFNATAKNTGGEIFENMIWQATINFQIDELNLDLPPDSRFNFAVTNYRLKLIKDKMSK
jgi:type IV secretion system protein VirB8